MARTEKGNDTTRRQTELQVMICTYGREGLQRVAEASHPKVEGVEYLVCCQYNTNEEDSHLPEKLARDDFRIIFTRTRGLSVNRNIALSKATAPLLLISDDDVDYSEEGLCSVIDAFHRYTDMDIITFRYISTSHEKSYPSSKCSLASPEKGYFVTSFEIAFRRDSIQRKVWFNENFGIGAQFPSGEEDLFIRDCMDAGMKGIFLPVTIARHDGMTTSKRNLMLDSRPKTKGAVFLRLYPRQWPLRMIVHALREFTPWRKGVVPSPISFCLNWIKGVRKARKMKVFPTPDYSLHYPCHD